MDHSHKLVTQLAKLSLTGHTLFTGDPELLETENGVENFPEKGEEITQRATPFDASKIAEDRSRSPSTKSADSISEAVFKPPVNSTPGKETLYTKLTVRFQDLYK